MADFPQRIGLLTGGGDAPGLNAVIRAVVRAATQAGCVCIGLENSFDGLLADGQTRELTRADVAGIERMGGTILGTTNRGDPFAYPDDGGDPHDYSRVCLESFRKLSLDAMVVVGGENSNNTRQLVHLCERNAVPAFHVQSAEDVQPQQFAKFRVVGLTAGTSTLDETIQQVHDLLCCLNVEVPV